MTELASANAFYGALEVADENQATELARANASYGALERTAVLGNQTSGELVWCSGPRIELATDDGKIDIKTPGWREEEEGVRDQEVGGDEEERESRGDDDDTAELDTKELIGTSLKFASLAQSGL
ncbi:hypothetical protein K440DRAFT_662267 [Wilcoxina mikolae CBS 423.85]|nr:hypothetical protein K440DRAFT_662267 [Wilcoxina mikolae CBS 423.85]